MTPSELRNRIDAIIGDLESLMADVNEAVPEPDAPDTLRLFESQYDFGPAIGLGAAKQALESLDDEELARALEPIDVQRARRDEPVSPDLAAFVAAVRKGPSR